MSLRIVGTTLCPYGWPAVGSYGVSTRGSSRNPIISCRVVRHVPLRGWSCLPLSCPSNIWLAPSNVWLVHRIYGCLKRVPLAGERPGNARIRLSPRQQDAKRGPGLLQHGTISSQSGIRPGSQSILICTTSHRIPASASTNHGPERGDLILL